MFSSQTHHTVKRLIATSREPQDNAVCCITKHNVDRAISKRGEKSVELQERGFVREGKGTGEGGREGGQEKREERGREREREREREGEGEREREREREGERERRGMEYQGAHLCRGNLAAITGRTSSTCLSSCKNGSNLVSALSSMSPIHVAIGMPLSS
jgi:hypothetical protein